MNFAYGIIAAVGVLVAISLGLIAADPGYLAEPSDVPDSAAAGAPAEAPAPAVVSLPMGSGSVGCESTNECFIPYSVSVGVGGTVTWNNDDTVAHTVTSGTLEAGHDGIFDSGLFMSGASFAFTFDEAGEYDYFCIAHPWMTGKVTAS